MAAWWRRRWDSSIQSSQDDKSPIKYYSAAVLSTLWLMFINAYMVALIETQIATHGDKLTHQEVSNERNDALQMRAPDSPADNCLHSHREWAKLSKTTEAALPLSHMSFSLCFFNRRRKKTQKETKQPLQVQASSWGLWLSSKRHYWPVCQCNIYGCVCFWLWSCKSVSYSGDVC